MPELIRFDDFRDYAKFNNDFIETNPMLYYHLEKTIERVFRRQVRLYKFFNITDENCFVSVLLIEDECLIYADNINEEVVTKLSEGLEFPLFKRYQFFGTKQIIDALFQLHNVNYDEQKHRIIYECTSTISDFQYSSGEMAMAHVQHLLELSQFNIAFTKEYYGDIQPLQKAMQTIASGIEHDNLYQWSNGYTICAIAQAIHNEYDFPVIGHVFVNPICRNKGYAASIVHRLTRGLLDVGHEKCMLTADAHNPASNKAFKKAGYRPIGEYVVRYKKV
jgi:RimJ/RimL family protein N-acetyltransferase